MLIQLIRYGLVGVVSNGLLLGIYFILTELAGLVPELAATMTFCLGVIWTYVFNRNWAFRSESAHRNAIPKYILSYVLAYFTTIGTLSFGHRLIGLPHLVSQILAILVSAVTLFALLRLWVFRDNHYQSGRS